MIDSLPFDCLIAIIIVMVAIIVILFILSWITSKKFKQKLKQFKDENDVLKKENISLEQKLSNAIISRIEIEGRFGKYSSMIQGFSGLVQKSYSEFLDDLLALAISLVPEAKVGSISIIDGKKWKFVAIRGNGKRVDELKSLDLKSDWMVAIPKVTVIEDITKENSKTLPKEYADLIEQAMGSHIYRSIAIPLKLGNDFVGNCFVDVLNDVPISDSSTKIMKDFSTMASIFLALKKLETLPKLNINNALRTMVNFYEMKNSNTRGHSENVAYFSVKIAESMKLSPKQIGELYWASILHDIGLIAIPDRIMEKPSKLTDEEFEMMKSHTLIGEKMLFAYGHLKEAETVARNHHENFDGSGYPDGIKGGNIPLLSRIVSIADAFDTMRRTKNCGEELSLEDSINQIEGSAGIQFDPEISKIAIQIFQKTKKDR